MVLMQQLKRNLGLGWEDCQHAVIDEFLSATSPENHHILWSFDPMSYLGANYLMVQLTVEQVVLATSRR